jgi:hypothetical protein
MTTAPSIPILQRHNNQKERSSYLLVVFTLLLLLLVMGGGVTLLLSRSSFSKDDSSLSNHHLLPDATDNHHQIIDSSILQSESAVIPSEQRRRLNRRKKRERKRQRRQAKKNADSGGEGNDEDDTGASSTTEDSTGNNNDSSTSSTTSSTTQKISSQTAGLDRSIPRTAGGEDPPPVVNNNIFTISRTGDGYTSPINVSEFPSAIPSESPTGAPTPKPSDPPTRAPSASPTKPPTPPPTADSQSLFSITLDFVDVDRQDIYWDSAAIWQQIIVGELPSVDTGGRLRMPSGCPRYPRIVDELHVCALEIVYDGPGGILGSAGPHYVRKDSGLPIGGHMLFDREDAARMISSSTDGQRWRNVVLHELAHVLGLGTLWHDGKTDNVNNSLVYQGENARRVWTEDWNCVGTGPPIELDGGSGTRGGHWDEKCFKNELMTGYLSTKYANPISKLTIAALDDLGYEVDYSKAQPYSPTADCCKGNLQRMLQDFFEEPTKPELSERGRKTAEDYGRKTLDQIHEEAPDNHDTEDLIYVGDSFLSVMYEENGFVYQIDVTVSR